MITREQIIQRLENILDPEIGMDIWTMGLIYEIDIKGENSVRIRMTFTSPLCPAGPYLEEEVKNNLREIGCSNVDIEITFDPPWQPPPALREALGI